MAKMTMVQAISLALKQEMERDDSVLVLGQDVGKDEGVFRVTSGLLAEFGERRVIDTPLAEAAIIGVSIGMAVYGLRPVAEIQFHGFDYQAFHQIEQHMARMRHRSQGRFSLPMVMRAPSAGGVRALEHHSESREAYYAHTPGLKVVMPSGPRNARALLVSAIRDPDPVIFLEPKSVYRAFREEVPDESETMPIGKAQVVQEGKDITLVSYGAMMRPTLEAAAALKEQDGVQAEVIDLLTVSPLDVETFTSSVLKTGRCLVVNEAPRSFSVAAEVIARLEESDFWYLEAPIRRVTGFDIIIPLYAREQAYLPNTGRVLKAARDILSA